jgi:hypothetical protein
MFDASESQLDVTRVSSSPGYDVAENGRDLRVGQFVMGYLEHNDRDGSRIGVRFSYRGPEADMRAAAERLRHWR